MRIAVFAPFACVSREAGIMYLLANYLQHMFPEVLQLRCNGIVSVCDRDAERSWRRSLDSCLTCGCDQARLAAWSGVKSSALSRYLLPRDIDETRRWVESYDGESLLTARFHDTVLYPLVALSFRNRFGVDAPDPSNKNHTQLLKRLLLSAARMYIACDRFNKKFLADMSLVADGTDYLSAVFINRCSTQSSSPAVFRWDLHRRSTTITHPRNGGIYSCGLLLDNVAAMRPDPCTWSEELLGIISEMLSFLGLSDTQLALPIAR